MHNSDFVTTNKDRSALTGYDFRSFVAQRQRQNLLVNLLFKDPSQFFRRLVRNGILQEFPVVFASKTIAFVVEDENGVQFRE